jgi:hypothetical protein
MSNRYVPIDPATLPHDVMSVFVQRGHAVTKASARQARCAWDGRSRLQYKVTSSTGRTTVWTPVHRPTVRFEVKLER